MTFEWHATKMLLCATHIHTNKQIHTHTHATTRTHMHAHTCACSRTLTYPPARTACLFFSFSSISWPSSTSLPTSRVPTCMRDCVRRQQLGACYVSLRCCIYAIVVVAGACVLVLMCVHFLFPLSLCHVFLLFCYFLYLF